MRLEQPPLLHDGGYWYVVPVSIVNGALKADVELTDFCAWISEDKSQAVIRTPQPVSGIKTEMLSGYVKKSRGRSNGI